MARKNSKTSDAARPLSCVLYIRVSTSCKLKLLLMGANPV